MLDAKKSPGKPSLTSQEIDSIFRKLEPYLKSGLSINKACIQAQIPKTTVYDLVKENQGFAEKIEACINHYSVLVNDIIYRELNRISYKQKSTGLSPEEMRFVMWTAVTSRATREEFDRKYPAHDSVETREEKSHRLILDNPKAIESLIKMYERLRQKLIAQDRYKPQD